MLDRCETQRIAPSLVIFTTYSKGITDPKIFRARRVRGF